MRPPLLAGQSGHRGARPPPKLGSGKEKDTKTHQNRRIELDTETVVLMKEHRERVKQRVESLGRRFTGDLFVFSGSKTPDHSEPYSPNAVTQRYKNMAARLRIDTYVHAPAPLQRD
jgi:integrase